MMTRTYLITYDLNIPGQNHQKVLDLIKNTYAWVRLSESSYAIRSDELPETIYRRFAPLLDGNDVFYVIQLNRFYFGQGTDERNNWLQQNL